MIDQELLLALYGFVNATPALSLIVVFCAKWLPYFLILFASIYALAPLFRSTGQGNLQNAVFTALYIFTPVFFAWLFVDLWKFASPLARPFVELSFTPLVSVGDPLGSFPSSHATVFAALGMAIFWQNKKIGTWFLVGAALVGLARIAAGVHYPIDILAGFLLGGALALFSHGFFADVKR
ncbi:MAG: phosphatase PAP2 family protein [bacterium]|nr:phosphatase PAP2 family protein [bacterium]